MKLVHITDTHLGLSAFSRLDPDTGMNLREKQIYYNFLASAKGNVFLKRTSTSLL